MSKLLQSLTKSFLAPDDFDDDRTYSAYCMAQFIITANPEIELETAVKEILLVMDEDGLLTAHDAYWATESAVLKTAVRKNEAKKRKEQGSKVFKRIKVIDPDSPH